MSGPTVYIVLFRGVGGATQLPTAPLSAALAEAGFERVATYINSGNAVVRTGLSRQRAAGLIAAICKRAFGFTKDIHLRTLDEWHTLIADNPFPEALDVPKFLHAAVLAGEVDPARLQALAEIGKPDDRIAVVGRVAYLHTPNGFGRSKLAEKFDKGIGVANTARNWNTVLKLEALAAQAADGRS